MTYYEAIGPMLYKAHKIKEVQVIMENPIYFNSSMLRIITEDGRTFYLEKDMLDTMQKYPNIFPLERRWKFAPAQTDKK